MPKISITQENLPTSLDGQGISHQEDIVGTLSWKGKYTFHRQIKLKCFPDRRHFSYGQNTANTNIQLGIAMKKLV